MARQIIERLIDDIDGGEANETVKFSLDGMAYEIDLSAINAANLRKALSLYIDRGIRAKLTPSRGRTSYTVGVPARSDKAQNKAIREWAARNNLNVAPRGRIAEEIVERYHREAGR